MELGNKDCPITSDVSRIGMSVSLAVTCGVTA